MEDVTPIGYRPLALVTGASSGIGRELARELAEREHDLIIVAEDQAIHDAARELSTITGVRAVQADLATSEGNEAVLDAVERDGRGLSVAAINAGVGVGGPLVDTDLEDHQRLVAVNVMSTVHLGKRVAEQMVEDGEGRILFTSSVASQMPGPLNSTYAASKSFVQSFAEGLRQELSDTGVTVTALMPGPTDTDFFQRADLEDTRLGRSPKDDPARVAREGIDALMNGHDHVVTGSSKNRLQTALGTLLPDPVKAKLHQRLNSSS